MRSLHKILALLLLIGSAGSALADHGHYYGGHRASPRVSIAIGTPYWGVSTWSPWYYPPPYYYSPYYVPPAVTVIRPEPQVYVEQTPAPVVQAPQPTQYWYYCNSVRAYYPYTANCPEGWVKVPAQPAGPNR